MILTYTSRVITMGGVWGFTTVDIPVASKPFEDPGAHTYKEHIKDFISNHTTVVAVTTRELIFGDVSTFTTNKDDVRNKFIVPHKEGSPQVKELLKQAAEWQTDRKNRLSIRSNGIIMVLADSAVPVAVITGVVDSLRESSKFSHVILAGGVL